MTDDMNSVGRTGGNEFCCLVPCSTLSTRQAAVIQIAGRPCVCDAVAGGSSGEC